MVKSFNKENLAEGVTWLVFLLATIIIAAFLPWYLSEQLLLGVLILFTIVLVIYYIRIKHLYLEVQDNHSAAKADASKLERILGESNVVLRHLKSGVVLLDSEQHIVYLSPAAKKNLMRGSDDEMIGRHIRLYLSAKPDFTDIAKGSSGRLGEITLKNDKKIDQIHYQSIEDSKYILISF